ncbi:hypothetical protein [Streptomyces ehimensis]|uniref:Uncharacterized protein n=1 Tax=Streptomyces ehimensis TaxID=68195 RepID=A0ABV9BW54_9ACTN
MELRSLLSWMAAEHELRGRARLIEGAHEPGTLGSFPEILRVTLEPGTVTGLVAVVVAWLRHRRSGSVTCRLTRRNGTSVEVSARRIREMDAGQVRELVVCLAEALESEPAPRESGVPSPAPRSAGES